MKPITTPTSPVLSDTRLPVSPERSAAMEDSRAISGSPSSSRASVPSSTPRPVGTAALGTERGREKVQQTLATVLRRPQSKVVAVVEQMGEHLGSHADGLEQALGGLDGAQRQRLRQQFHYSWWQRGNTTPADRLVCRAAVALAFTRGASLEQVEVVRQRFDQAAGMDARAAMLAQLRREGPYVPCLGVDKVRKSEALADIQALRAACRAFQPENARQRAANEERVSILNGIEGQNEQPGCTLFRLSTEEGLPLGLMRVSNKSEVGSDPGGPPAVTIQYLVTHPQARGVALPLIEEAVAEAARSPGATPTVVLNAATRELFNHYERAYGFASCVGGFDDNSPSGGAMSLSPATSAKWRRTGDRYELSEPTPIQLPEAQASPPPAAVREPDA